MKICDILKRNLAILTYIYLNVDECWLTSSNSREGFNFKFLSIVLMLSKMCFLDVLFTDMLAYHIV